MRGRPPVTGGPATDCATGVAAGEVLMLRITNNREHSDPREWPDLRCPRPLEVGRSPCSSRTRSSPGPSDIPGCGISVPSHSCDEPEAVHIGLDCLPAEQIRVLGPLPNIRWGTKSYPFQWLISQVRTYHQIAPSTAVRSTEYHLMRAQLGGFYPKLLLRPRFDVAQLGGFV